MSDSSQGTGWWQASDGKWYPPHLHPGDAAGSAESEPGSGATPTRGRSLGRLIVVASSVILIAAVGVGIGLYMTSKASAIGLGAGSATITWKPVGTGSAGATSGTINRPPQSFTGTIKGIGVSGSARLIEPPTSALAPGALSFPFQRYTGTFDGKSFNLEVTVSLPRSAGTSSTTPSADTGFVVSGTWGSDHVHAVVALPINPNSASTGFHGNVGQWKVTGTIHQPTSSGGLSTATADFTVSQ